jgi:hypothetical protein
MSGSELRRKFAIVKNSSHQFFRSAAPLFLLAGLTLTIAGIIVWPQTSHCLWLQASHRDQILHPTLGQNDEDEQSEVSTDQIEKYVSVYKAMQRNRSLTVDQAAAQQGLTLQQFRELENRVQRDDAALQQARDELQAAALQASPRPEKKTHHDRK